MGIDNGLDVGQVMNRGYIMWVGVVNCGDKWEQRIVQVSECGDNGEIGDQQWEIDVECDGNVGNMGSVE